MEKKIEALKKGLDEAVEQNHLKSESILELSRELDELIVEYYEKNPIDKNISTNKKTI